MPPQTRSRGVPPSNRVYHSTPAQQQAHFPPRRKVSRTYGKQTRKKEPIVPARSMRQQTLTQIDFVSSFEEDHDQTIFSDSDNEDPKESTDEAEVDEDKENRSIKHEEVDGDDVEIDEDEDPVSSGRKRRATSRTAKDRAKRRRTLGDDDTEDEPTVKREKKENRRRTLGDLPTSSFHTQTLTQFLGRDPANALYIKDSEDEDEDDDGFRDWLHDPTSPSPLRRRQASSSPTTQRRLRFASPKVQQRRSESVSVSADVSERQESVVPQTPVKRTIRDEIPSSSQLSTPPSAMMARYGAPNDIASPLKNKSSPASRSAPRSILKELPGKPRTSLTPRRKEVVIQDSFATDSWGTGDVTPLRSQPLQPLSINEATSTETSSAADDMETPTKPRRRGDSTELGDRMKNKTDSPTPKKKASPRKANKKVALDEIPDSDADDDDFEVFDENQDEGDFVAGPETQFAMNHLASSEEEESEQAKITPPPVTADHVMSSAQTSKSRHRHPTSSPPLAVALSSEATTLLPPSSPLQLPRPSISNRPRLRKPLHKPTTHTTQTQPLESQRVPLTTLQTLPAASARTDIIPPLEKDTLLSILEGFQVHIDLPFKIPGQVVRFWLFDGQLLQYMACTESARIEAEPGKWRYDLPQVYELNNPVDDNDMREEEWVDGEIGRYAYLPPAVVGQLMWNLRHSVFGEGSQGQEEDDEDDQVQLLPSSSAPPRFDKNPTPTPSISVSQQVEAQLQSDIAQSTQFPTSDDILVPSTPEDEGKELNTASSTPTRASPHKSTAFKAPPSRLPPLGPYTASSYRASRPATNPPLPQNPPSTGVRPSQATTVSQASTPEKSAASSARRPPSYPQIHSDSSLVFQDDSPLRMPPGFSGPAVPHGSSSQLLSKSQMLPDSLVCDDDSHLPPEIWDSDEEGDAPL